MEPDTLTSFGKLRRTVLSLILFVLVSQLAMGALSSSEGNLAPVYFTGICSCIHGKTVYRTQFEFMNEAESIQTGEPGSEIRATLTFFKSDGSPMEVAVAPKWVGLEGTFENAGSAFNFTVPFQSTLVLSLTPQQGASQGWAELSAEGPLNPQAYIQASRAKTSGDGSPLEESLLYEAQLNPTPASKDFVLPISLFSGMKRLSTAFSLANLSAVSSRVELTLRPGNTRELVLAPGELIAEFFQDFWTVAFPAIFPLEYRGTAEIRSSSPLSLGAFRTINGYPNSGVRPVFNLGESRDPDVEASLDEPFELPAGQIAEVDGIRIEFWNVAEESRCPTDVQCIWEGRVRIEIRLSGPDGKVSARLSPVEGEDTVEFGELQIRLLEVNPEPVSTETLEFSDYRIQLIVSEG